MFGHQALMVAPLRQPLRSLNEALGSLRELFDIHTVSFRCPKHTKSGPPPTAMHGPITRGDMGAAPAHRKTI